jgi:hypothetical protein
VITVLEAGDKLRILAKNDPAGKSSPRLRYMSVARIYAQRLTSMRLVNRLRVEIGNSNPPLPRSVFVGSLIN